MVIKHFDFFRSPISETHGFFLVHKQRLDFSEGLKFSFVLKTSLSQ